MIATGVLLSSLFPHDIDVQGPMFFVRLFISLGLLLPCLASSAFLLALTHVPVFALATALIMALGEGYVLLSFAAFRLDHRGPPTNFTELTGTEPPRPSNLTFSS